MTSNNVPGSHGSLKKVGTMNLDVTPSAVRTSILKEHDLLRSDLKKIEMELAEYDRNPAGFRADRLYALIEEFSSRFLAHLELEERHLRPVLETIDGWGKVRIEHLDREHKAQRQEIAELIASSNRKESQALLAHLRKFVPALREDMSEEENEFLHSDLLRDDVITITQGS